MQCIFLLLARSVSMACPPGEHRKLLRLKKSLNSIEKLLVIGFGNGIFFGRQECFAFSGTDTPP
jgi:hypothetical protein